MACSFATCLGVNLDYIGMGALFYEDFKEFKAGGFIDGMTSIEYMGGRDGSIDELKYRRFMQNRPFESIRILPVLAGEAVDILPFDRDFLVWFDYDSELTRGKIESLANVIRKTQASGMLVSSTSTKTEYYYMATGSRRDLDMDTVRAKFGDMVDPDNREIWEELTGANFSQMMRDAAEPYYQRVVADRNKAEHRNYQLRKVGRIEYRETSWIVADIWLLVDADKVNVELFMCGFGLGGGRKDVLVYTAIRSCLVPREGLGGAKFRTWSGPGGSSHKGPLTSAHAFSGHFVVKRGDRLSVSYL